MHLITKDDSGHYHAGVRMANCIRDMFIVAWIFEPYCHGQTEPSDEFIGVYLLRSTDTLGRHVYYIGTSEVMPKMDLLKSARITIANKVLSKFARTVVVPGTSQEMVNKLFLSFFLGMSLCGFKLPVVTAIKASRSRAVTSKEDLKHDKPTLLRTYRSY